jgi:hypothetical protein
VTIRVIQWATGPVGSVQLTEVIDNPGFDQSATGRRDSRSVRCVSVAGCSGADMKASEKQSPWLVVVIASAWCDSGSSFTTPVSWTRLADVTAPEFLPITG